MRVARRLSALLLLSVFLVACDGSAPSGSGAAPDVSSDPSGPGGKTDGPFGDIEATRYGRSLVVEAFPSEYVDQPHKVVVYLPAAYDADADARFPVLYMHDGQNLFANGEATYGTEWRVDETLDRLVDAGTVPPLVVVGIWSTDARMAEYTPSVDPTIGDGGRAPDYAKFVVREVKPWVDATLRTKPGRADTGLAGSSLGGLVSLYMLAEYPDVFGRVGCVSTSLWWNGAEALDYVDPILAAWAPGTRLWIDAGSAEGNDSGTDEGGNLDPDGDGVPYMVGDARLLRDALLAGGRSFGRDVGFYEAQGAAHMESAWAARLPSILTFLWATDRPTTPRTLRPWLYRTRPLVGETFSLAVESRFADDLVMTLPPRQVTLGSSDATVAAVDADGLVRALRPGPASITATLGALSGAATLEVRPDVSDTVTLTFAVAVPASTPAADTIYLTGDHATLGAWDPAGLALVPTDGVWTGAIELPRGTTIAFKATRGTFETVEKAADGSELADRTWTANEDATVEVDVARWADEGETP